MPVTGLLMISDASTNIATVSSINDHLIRLFPKSLGRWFLEYKLLRENPVVDQGVARSEPGSGNPRFLSELYLSHHPDKTFCLIDEARSQASGGTNNGKRVMCAFDRGMSAIITTKLSSLWLLRQSMRAEGLAFAIGDDFIVRTGNVTQTGAFKFVLVEIEDLRHDELSSAKSNISSFVSTTGFPPGRLFFGDTVHVVDDKQRKDSKFSVSDTGLQYMEAFRMRPNN
ncbi:mediator complex, subunit Med20 [Lipomyces arxii]|uniref:mediator complex, subunit Med20 n=1 Tax=Lipomyces arxii TaxID=56418 RepID=UPI0034CE3452